MKKLEPRGRSVCRAFLLILAFPILFAQAAEIRWTRPACKSPASDLFFFAKDSLEEDDSDKDQLLRAAYSKHLRAMSEPSLSCKRPLGEVYRFLWLRSKHHPIAVRIDSRADVATLTATELAGAGGHDPGKVGRRIERVLAEKEWAQVSKALRDINFWEVPPRIRSSGADGSQWILEGRKESQYHIVDRSTPKASAYRDVCLLFLKLAGFPTILGTGKEDPVY